MQLHVCTFKTLMPVCHEPVYLIFKHVTIKVELEKSHFSLSCSTPRCPLSEVFQQKQKKPPKQTV